MFQHWVRWCREYSSPEGTAEKRTKWSSLTNPPPPAHYGEAIYSTSASPFNNIWCPVEGIDCARNLLTSREIPFTYRALNRPFGT
jgi:hypothetical protein